jgi:hypothetical protein
VPLGGKQIDTDQVELVPVLRSPGSAQTRTAGQPLSGALKTFVVVALVLGAGTVIGTVAFISFGKPGRTKPPTAGKPGPGVPVGLATGKTGKTASSQSKNGTGRAKAKTRFVTREDLQLALDRQAAEQKHREDRAWLREVNQEIADAIENRNRRIGAVNMQLGGMNRGELNRSQAALRFILKRQSLKSVPPNIVELATRIDPGVVKWLQDELLIQSGAAPELARRKELFLELRGIVGKRHVWWHLFDLGTNEEIGALIRDLCSKPFRELTRRQRLIILGAGGSDYVMAFVRVAEAKSD